MSPGAPNPDIQQPPNPNAALASPDVSHRVDTQPAVQAARTTGDVRNTNEILARVNTPSRELLMLLASNGVVGYAHDQLQNLDRLVAAGRMTMAIAQKEARGWQGVLNPKDGLAVKLNLEIDARKAEKDGKGVVQTPETRTYGYDLDITFEKRRLDAYQTELADPRCDVKRAVDLRDKIIPQYTARISQLQSERNTIADEAAVPNVVNTQLGNVALALNGVPLEVAQQTQFDADPLGFIQSQFQEIAFGKDPKIQAAGIARLFTHGQIPREVQGEIRKVLLSKDPSEKDSTLVDKARNVGIFALIGALLLAWGAKKKDAARPA